jgi:hypothetical protein
MPKKRRRQRCARIQLPERLTQQAVSIEPCQRPVSGLHRDDTPLGIGFPPPCNACSERLAQGRDPASIATPARESNVSQRKECADDDCRQQGHRAAAVRRRRR